jgi:SAM-dependent methyltransferase
VWAEDPYRDPDLVALYDVDNPAGADHDFYRALAREVNARTIIDLGCGTGLLTRTLATTGRTVLGVDPSRTMLDYARSRPGAQHVRWILGDASALPADADVDLVVCTGNTIMHLNSHDLAQAFAAIATALRPGGTLGFETRNPAAREWERWTPEATYGERRTHLGLLREWLEVTSVADGRVAFDAHNLLPSGEDRVYTSVLHFHPADRVEQQLRQAGFGGGIRIRGGWHDEAVTDDARVLVFRAELG